MATMETMSNAAEDMQSQNEALKKELRALKAEKAKREAEEKAAAARAKENASDPRRMVEIELFADTGKYKDALYVNVNNYNAVIPRGKRVSVPYFVAKHIMEMQEQDRATANMIRVYEAEWKQRSMAAGL